MKRKKLGFMNIKHEVLSRSEMKSIMAGSGGSGVCRVYRNDGVGWTDCMSLDDALIWYDGGSGSTITGYCCASCGSGDFSNADPCY